MMRSDLERHFGVSSHDEGNQHRLTGQQISVVSDLNASYKETAAVRSRYLGRKFSFEILIKELLSGFGILREAGN